MLETISRVDTAFQFIFGISFAIMILITLVAVFFLFKYHHTKHPDASEIDGNVAAELTWTIIPTLIVLAMFWFGWSGYKALRSAPADSMEVQVTARMWSWKFEYPNGKTSKELYVPANKPVKLNMTSLDVIHSFYVPAYRVKMDTVPGMNTYVWFNAGEPAQYDILCAEYCGVRHAFMLSKVVVLPEEEYELWLASDEQPSTDKPEAVAILEKHGCIDCHSLDGTELVGPTFKDIYGRETVVVTPDGEMTVTADEKYLETAIYDPSAEIVKNYEDMMPPFKDEMSGDELDTVIEYFKSGGTQVEKPGEKGRVIAENEGCTGCHSTDGSILVGPSFKNMIDRNLTAVKDGKKVQLKADARYIISSITHPSEYIVDGFDESMPPYDYLDDEQIKALIEYFNTLKD
ncbi:cytochrome c oxidase, subunit II [Denitrovibrio acetiphilus DSM 12809]|uniref:Cytochrome c oxidase subunit 2 n=1 Tax=Denitrovibrio acetiphilus (strain DSM 12809 / NBRC 114555 / N2460) TaxID=522772 RepID=D4H6R5_DENA2|nr:cytochrome c oxidase subunit II [Denitrovibrio acetiphilus]ADD67781.1 cytochrome c oxidase, subunit II [Denitrovibrio acetiphilus DSM 12809]